MCDAVLSLYSCHACACCDCCMQLLCITAALSSGPPSGSGFFGARTGGTPGKQSLEYVNLVALLPGMYVFAVAATCKCFFLSVLLFLTCQCFSSMVVCGWLQSTAGKQVSHRQC